MASMREKILAAEDLPQERVKTDEWAPSGVPFVVIRALTSSERDEYEQSLLITRPDGRRVTNPNLKNVRAGFVAKVMLDPDTGERIFDDSHAADLAGKNAALIDRLWDVGRRLSGMQTEEELEKEGNPSTGDQPGSPSSDSA